MNFFENQDRARRLTVLLVIFYAATVACIAVAVYLTAVIGWNLAQSSHAPSGYSPPIVLWNPMLFLDITAGVLVVILFGTLSKTLELNQGGRVVAEMLDGAPLLPGTDDPDEKRVLNVVEEMAIASGTAVPPVYLLKHERGINAFAAGFTPRDAVIGVTEGCVRILDRDELQGVIAHEYSHILNGDMRLSIRLMGILYGILLLSSIGRVLMRVNTGRSRSKGSAGIALAGLGLFLIGWIGVFFANLIKSAISRERESLADASGVQFTRYPAGLAGALKKIGGLEQKSYLTHGRADEASHLYFAEGVNEWLSSLFATHPPLVQRIRALDPQFDGTFPEVDFPETPAARAALSNKAPSKAGLSRIPLMEAMSAATVVAQAGRVDEARLAYTADLLDQIPDLLKQNAREPFGASAVIYSLLLDRKDPAVKEAQRRLVYSKGSYAVFLKLKLIDQEVEKTKPELRLPLVDLAMPALAMLSPRQYAAFRENASTLIEADGKVQPFELALKLVLFHHLDRRFEMETEPRKASGDKNPERCAADLVEIIRRVGSGQAATIDAVRVEEALGVLKAAPFKFKEKVIHDMAEAVLQDRQVLPEELEMIRAFADTLDCPLPPLQIPAGMIDTKISKR